MSVVFLCYESRDAAWVRAIALKLEAIGFHVRYDQRFADPEASSAPHEALPEALQDADYVLPLLSENFCQSTWTPIELGFALDRESRFLRPTVIPVIVGEECPTCRERFPMRGRPRPALGGTPKDPDVCELLAHLVSGEGELFD